MTVINEPDLLIRALSDADPPRLALAFAAIGWAGKSQALFERYLAEQRDRSRTVLLATLHDEVTGYVTVNFSPSYPPLAAAGTPELQDLSVPPRFRRRGIATRLLDQAEGLVAARSATVGIGVGLHPGYNAAQRLYALRGYVPDGNGITVRDEFVREGQTIVLDDDVVLHLEKSLKPATA